MHGSITVTGAQATSAAAPTASAGAPTGGGNVPPSTVANVGGSSVSESAGFALIGPPAGTVVGASAVYAFDPQTNSYRALGPGEGTQAGQGYWAFFNSDAMMNLGGGSNGAVSLDAAAGAWQLIGDPSDMLPALVTGADAVFTYDAGSGAYVATTMLQPGQGAWAMVLRGGKITITPGGTAALTPTPTPAPQRTPQPTPYVAPVSAPMPQPMPQPVNPYPRPY
jgi:hypothetical protein